MSFPLRPAALLMLALAATAPARAHTFQPTQAAGIDVFLDKGPAVLSIDGQPCHAEMLMASQDTTVATVSSGKTTKPTFFLKVFGKQAGTTTVTVTVNDGFFINGGEKQPCGEGGTVYTFDVRVWPSEAAYEKKLKGVLKTMVANLTGSAKKELAEGVKQALAALKAFKASQVGLGPDPSAWAQSGIEATFATATVWNNAHRRLQAEVEAAKEQGGALLQECGFGEPHVVAADVVPGSVHAGGAGQLHVLLEKGDATLGKSLDKLDAQTKKVVDKYVKDAFKSGVLMSFTRVEGKLKASLVSSLFPLGVSKGPPPGSPPASPLLGPVFSVDALGIDPSLHVTGLAAPRASLSLSVRTASGFVAEDFAVLADDEGDFSASFDKGVPRGQAVEVVVTDDATGDSDATVLHIAHHAQD